MERRRRGKDRDRPGKTKGRPVARPAGGPKPKAKAGAPKRAPPVRRQFPVVPATAEAPAQPGEWLLTTRPGGERDLIEEMYFLDDRCAPRPAGPSLVAARALPLRRTPVKERLVPAFARQGFPVAYAGPPQAAAIGAALARALGEASKKGPCAWALDRWVPDHDRTNPLDARAGELAEASLAFLPEGWRAARVGDGRAALADNGLYAQLALVAPDRALAGVLHARDAPILAPGGRLRVHVGKEAPSRSAMKLVEALAWLDRTPEPGDLIVDLGAAPGGWTWVMLERRAKVIAVDPGNLDRSLAGRRGLTHARGNAFQFAPTEPADWLLCDMAYRPLEVAGLLARWARMKWARLLIANLKLPMKTKAEHMLRVADILSDGGWGHLRMRQLYHDRDEVTFAGTRLK
jgi:23S rRNA (cytidine2498-2'-O)-methyltransferase